MKKNINVLFRESEQAVVYMLREITHICRNMKTRAPGSEGELEAAEYMAGVLERECGCRDVKTETFTLHPSAFYGYFYIASALDTLNAVCFFIDPRLSLLFGALGLFVFITQFILYKQLIDPLFPKKQSVNVTAVRPCRGEVKQRIFLNGHIDAAWEFPLNHYFGGIVFEIPGVVSLAGGISYMILSVCALCGAGEWVHTVGKWLLIVIPFFILMAFTYNPKRIVDGANDNLSGCYIGISLLREMERLGVDLEHTEIGVILTGSEEAGLRGAKAWCKAHKDDFRDVPAYIVSFDTIHDPRCLMVNKRDLNGTVASDAELCDIFLAAAKDADVTCRAGMVPLFGGSTDSAAFTQAGFRSMGVTGLNHVLEDYYHTRRDSYDNMDQEGLENCYKALIRFIEMIDG